MKKLSVFCSLFAVAVTSSASAGTLTLSSPSNYNSASSVTVATNAGSNSYTGAPLNFSGTLLGGETFTFVTSAGTVLKVPNLTGSAGDLKITSVDDGNMIRVKTMVSVSNTGTKAAKNVSATIYLSKDAVLDASDTKVKTLYLADYVPEATKLLKGQTLSLPFKQKVPASIASYLEGKYIIAVLSADNLATPVQVVVGPIQLPTAE